jgi:hypothetical protein
MKEPGRHEDANEAHCGAALLKPERLRETMRRIALQYGSKPKHGRQFDSALPQYEPHPPTT